MSEIRHVHPEVVIYSRPPSIAVGTNNILVGIELSLDPTRKTKIWVGEHSLELPDSELESVLVLIEEVKKDLPGESERRSSKLYFA